MTDIKLGATIGIIGDGMDTAYTVQAAQQLGFRVVVYNPVSYDEAGRLAYSHTIADYNDENELKIFARSVQVLIYTTSKISSHLISELTKLTYIPQNADILEFTQDRLLLKAYLQTLDIKGVAYETITSTNDLKEALIRFGGKGVLKSNVSGTNEDLFYFIEDEEDSKEVAQTLNKVSILEEWIEDATEFSIVIAIDRDKRIIPVTLSQTFYKEGWLLASHNPPIISQKNALKAFDICGQLLEPIDFVGVFIVDFFCRENGELLVNGIQSFPTITARYTIHTENISQYEAFIRTITNIPMGAVEHYIPGGQLMFYPHDEQDAFDVFQSHPHYQLNVYPDYNNEMTSGHLNIIADDLEDLNIIVRKWTNI